MTNNGHGETAGRILLVEDDLVAGRLLTELLSVHGGFEVRHLSDPAQALKLAGAEAWDLVLTDVEMPGMTGHEIVQELRQLRPGLPVAVITSHASLDNAVQALREEASEFLEKSAPPDELVASISALVAKGRAERLATRQSVLAIGAHPDDVEIGAAGALLAHRAMGHDVSILTLSRGARGGAGSTRAGESEMAALALGATLYLEDLQDTRIGEGDPTIGAISRVVESVRPTVVYTHSLHDVHQDHRNTHRAAMVAARQVRRVYCFQSPSATVDFRPRRFVTIDEQLERKLLAIQAFASQTQVRTYLEPSLIESTARYWSRFGDGRFAEAFEVVREAASDGQPEGPAIGVAAAEPGAEAEGMALGPPDAPGGAGNLAAVPAGAAHDHPEVPHGTR
ncbi:MAG TPA: response regulator [Streptosporangiaceae bacterium]|jgi:LmbE family N-acetylglucosaminyl deacetylase|nr:response regulator [Streptosporangiaceae bacterium]